MLAPVAQRLAESSLLLLGERSISISWPQPNTSQVKWKLG